MTDCIFCKIIAKEVPADLLYEDDYVIAFLDINPVAKGHCLVLPKQHYEKLEDIPEDLLKEFIVRLKKIAKILIKATEKEGFNIVVNNGKAAGQLVFHSHWHIMPRSKDDGVDIRGHKLYKYEEGEKEEIIKKFKEILENES